MVEPTMPNHQQDDMEGCANNVLRSSSSQEEKRMNGNHLDQIEMIMGSMEEVMQGMQIQGGCPYIAYKIHRLLRKAESRSQ